MIILDKIKESKPILTGEHEIDGWRANYYTYQSKDITIIKYKDNSLAPYAVAINDIWQKGRFFNFEEALESAISLCELNNTQTGVAN